MIKYGIPSWLVRMVKITLEKANNKVKIHGEMSPSFKTVVGLMQGDILSMLLFNLCGESYKQCDNKPRRYNI
jgi:hypothetical protein